MSHSGLRSGAFWRVAEKILRREPEKSRHFERSNAGWRSSASIHLAANIGRLRQIPGVFAKIMKDMRKMRNSA
jgi:hypothetical protein